MPAQPGVLLHEAAAQCSTQQISLTLMWANNKILWKCDTELDYSEQCCIAYCYVNDKHIDNLVQMVALNNMHK